MDVITTILKAAKVAKVSGALLVAICSHESQGFTVNYTPQDKGSPSYSFCQIKERTAVQMGFRGRAEDLNRTEVGAKFAARYLKYQEKRYGDSWLHQTAAYNSGTYNPSNKVVGCPRNLAYIKLVKSKLPSELQGRLECGGTEVAERGF